MIGYFSIRVCVCLDVLNTEGCVVGYLGIRVCVCLELLE